MPRKPVTKTKTLKSRPRYGGELTKAAKLRQIFDDLDEDLLFNPTTVRESLKAAGITKVSSSEISNARRASINKRGLSVSPTTEGSADSLALVVRLAKQVGGIQNLKALISSLERYQV